MSLAESILAIAVIGGFGFAGAVPALLEIPVALKFQALLNIRKIPPTVLVEADTHLETDA